MKQNRYDHIKAFLVKKIADKYTVNPAFVYMVLRGERIHDKIFDDYMEVYQEATTLVDNLLLKAVNQAVPFA